MALFPAYNEELKESPNSDTCKRNNCDSNESDKGKEGQVWLENRSFGFQAPTCSTSLDKSEVDPYQALKKETAKNKKKNEERRQKKEIGKCKKEKKKKFRNKYKEIKDKKELLRKRKKKPRKPKTKSPVKEQDAVNETPENQSEIISNEFPKKLTETEILEQSRDYRTRLRDCPHDINLWIDYINFQDNAVTDSASLIQEKLRIMNNALSVNKSDDRLLLLKYSFVNEKLSYDEANAEVRRDLEETDDSNAFLWGQQISLFLYSLTYFNATKAFKLYAGALRNINTGPVEKTLGIHKELYTFIRQTGLWELLCKIIILNLQVNFGEDNTANIFDFQPLIRQNIIEEYEEEILLSGLPLNSLWSRLEILRSRVYWYPTEDPSCTDPQRMILTSDVSDCLYPIVDPDHQFVLAVYSLIALKVPMLPFRHCSFVGIQLKNIPWYLDSSEILLAGYFDDAMLPVCTTNCTFLKQLQQLVTNPQYIVHTIGTDEFKSFITNIFQHLIKYATNAVHLNAFLLWWIRFERWLLSFESEASTTKNETLNRVISKAEKYRDNVFLYVEYALLVKDLKGSVESCLSILNKVLKHKQISGVPVFQYNDEDKASLTYLYKIYSRLLLSANRKRECLQRLICLALGENKDVDDDAVIDRACLTYGQVIDDCLTKQNLSRPIWLWEIMQPQFLTEWMSCYAMILYVTRSASSSIAIMKSYSDRLPRSDNDQVITLASYYREIITEINVNILEYDDYVLHNSGDLFSESLTNAVQTFPNNAYFLKTFATFEIRMWDSWRNIPDNSALFKTDSCLLAVVLCLISITKVCEFKKRITTTSTSTITEHDDQFCSTRICSIISRFVKNSVGERCPLIWLIFLQFTDTFETADKYKDLFYLALEKCPWTKLLYQEASGVLDHQLNIIQDMLIEKELRIYVSPEELAELAP